MSEPPLPEHHVAIMRARAVFMLLCVVMFLLALQAAVFGSEVLHRPQQTAEFAVAASLFVFVYPWKLSQPSARALLKSATEKERLTTSRAVRNMYIGFSVVLAAMLGLKMLGGGGGDTRSWVGGALVAMFVIGLVVGGISLTVVFPALVYRSGEDSDER